MKPVARIAMIFLALVALAHLLRVTFHIPVIRGRCGYPLVGQRPGVRVHRGAFGHAVAGEPSVVREGDAEREPL